MTLPAFDRAALRGRRVLVTGASGFSGSHLVRALAQYGAQVRALVRHTSAITGLVAAKIELVVGDIRDRRFIEEAVAGCDQVYHLAALYRDASVPRQVYWDVNVTGTDHVLAACERARVSRLIHCSTMGVHGHVAQVPSDETAPFNPDDDYQRAKLAGEERVWAWAKRSGIPTTVVRPAGIYGPGDLRFLKLFRSIRDGYFVMLGSGKTWFHPVYVDDLIQGFLRCGTHEAAIGEAFCIASERYVTLNELAGSIADVVGVARPRWHAPVWPFYLAGAACEAVCVPLQINPPLHRRRVGFFTHSRAFTNAKAQRLLGYAPEVSLEDGLRRTAEWYATHGYLRPTNGAAGHHAP